MSFCGKCGSPIGNGKFCPKCGAPREIEVNETNLVNIKNKGFHFQKKIIAGIVITVVVVVLYFILKPTVNKPCDWCGNSPSVAYELSDGSKAYICKECSSECAFCGDKATKHYENLLETLVFVCDDCYEEVSAY